MEKAQTAQVQQHERALRPQREARLDNFTTQPTQANPPALLGQFSTYTPLKMNKARALKICEQIHLIQRPRGSDKGPEDLLR